MEDPTLRIVADTILTTNAFQSEYDEFAASNGLKNAIQGLSSLTLGDRRAALLEYWRELHAALGIPPPKEIPSDGVLRKKIEERALGELSSCLVAAKGHQVAARLGLLPPTADSEARVIVIGGVTMDLTFRIEEYPEHEMSTQASRFKMTPGGKGFMQAIAAARLGLKVSLLAAIADDGHRQVISGQLQAAGVDLSLLKIVDGAESALTGVFELPRGDSKAVNWRGTAALTSDDITESAATLEACDAILMTFEIPHDVMEATLALTGTFAQPRPIIIVTPGQPYVGDEKIDHRLLANVDYLVARKWELDRLFSTSHPELENDDLFEYLLGEGVKQICLMADQGPTVYSAEEPFTFGVTLAGTYGFPKSAISRDAFCAALASRLIEAPSTPVDEHLKWATAAMARTATDFTASAKANDKTPGANSLPDRHRIEEKLKAANRLAAHRREHPPIDDVAPESVS
jgi:ribokinase